MTARTRQKPALSTKILLSTASVALSVGGVFAATTADAAASAPHPRVDAAAGACHHISTSARPYVRPGNQGKKVKQVQCLINSYSKYRVWLDVDGKYGTKTGKAIKWVQRCNRTSGGVDGIVGPSTWYRLYHPKAQCGL